MSDSGTYRIRPAGRHILTIGRDLIQNNYAAVIEIVKNAYDADSTHVNVEFKHIPKDKKYYISITDYGHGMSRDTVINKWMVPSTTDKFKRKKSPSGRTMQGSKGIGRYAASVLGKDLLLETTTPNGEKTTVYVEWSAFEEADFLDDVELLIETTKGKLPQGTKLTITESDENISQWNEKNFKKLKTELKKLLSPVGQEINTGFNIFLTVEGFSDELDQNEKIEPFPFFELFDYKISGRIDANGKGVLTYFNQKARNVTQEEIDYDVGKPTDCGELFFDIRVYDREKEAIESLIARGLKDEKGKYFSNNEARDLLNTSNGIGVYRNDFRIRPLGDADFDWLELNKQRVQNPSLKISSNQVIGYILIQSEEQSKLIEKSARDGLRENLSYENLIEIAKSVIAKLEEKRFSYRRKTGLGRRYLKIERAFEQIYSFDKLRHGIQDKLRLMNVNKETTEEFIEIINKDEIEKGKIIDGIYREVAIYQGQATLGKIINVILHEGRSPLNYFKNQISNLPDLDYWRKNYADTESIDDLEKFISIADGIERNMEIFVDLFSRLDPLASRGKESKKTLVLKKNIEGATKVFEKKINELNIKIEISGSDDFCFQGWYQDIYAIFVNLIDNSIYWIGEKNPTVRNINIELVTNDNLLSYIDYKDSGPGIEPAHIASEVIFEPQFTTKPSGTGLGLAIAGESAARNGLKLTAYESDEGVYFRLQPKEKD